MFWTFFFWFATSVIQALLTPAPKSASASSLGDFDLPTAEEGRPLPLIYGTCKISGPNVTWWGDLKIDPIKEETDGFLGIGSKEYTVGYKYFLGIQMCLGIDQIDELVDIEVGEKSLTAQGASVNVVRNSTHPDTARLSINITNMFGGDKLEGGVSGDVDIYFGTSNQGSNDYLSSKWGRTAPAFRGCCYAVLRQCYIGTTNYPKKWAWVIRRCPIGTNVWNCNIDGDANPSAIIYDLLTLPTYRGGLGIPVARIDTDSFYDAQATLYSEGLGMSILIDTAKQADEWLTEICRHIDGVLYTDPATGKWTLKLVRNDYNPASLIVLNHTNIIGAPKIKRPSWSETLNNIVVRYCDRSAGYVTKVVQTRDLANRTIRSIDELSVIDYFGFSNAANALRTCERERRTHAYPVAGASITCNRIAYGLRPGSVFKLDWPTLGFEMKVMRVTQIRYGTLSDGKLQIEIEAIEDVFSALPANPSVDPPSNQWANPVSAPQKVVYGAVVTAPYWLVGESYNAIAMAERADRTTQAMDVWVSESPSTPGVWRKATVLPSSTPSATLKNILPTSDYPIATIVVDGGFDIDRVYDPDGGSAAETFAGKHLCLIDNEWIAFVNVVKNPDNTWNITGARRGVLDSVPVEHAAGTRVWFPTSGCCLTSVSDGAGSSGGGGGLPGAKGDTGEVGPQGPQGEKGDKGDPGMGIPTGGTYSQILRKKSAVDYDTEWVDASAGGDTSVTSSTQATTDTVTPGTLTNITVQARKTCAIVAVETDYPAAVNLYGNTTERTADMNRPDNQDPVAGEGCFLDVATETGDLIVWTSDVPVFHNHDTPATGNIYLSVRNLDTVNRAITVTVYYVPMEI